MPASRDETNWTRVEGDHADDATYLRSPLAPTATPTDEARTAEEAEGGVEDDADASGVDGINATQGAIDAAAELGVDLYSVSGTGADGRITKADVEGAAA